MLNRLLVVIVVGFWAVMMGSLVRRWLLEVKPEFVPGTYRSVLTASRENYQSRMGIFVPGKTGLRRLGYTETVFLYTPDHKRQIATSTRVQVPAPGLLQRLGPFDLDTLLVVGRDFKLERFSLALKSSTIQLECTGTVDDGDLVLTSRLKGEEEEVQRFPLPPGGLVAGGLSPLLALPPLRPGLQWSSVVMNPLPLEATPVRLEVVRTEPLEWEGRTWETYLVAVRSGYVRAQAWVSAEGEVLKETTIFGLTFIKEPLPEKGGKRPGDALGKPCAPPPAK